jgi:small ubiquitin-related modifier
MSAEGEDVKPKQEASASEHLNLKVKSQDGNAVFFKVKKSTQLKKLMDAYCTRVGADPKSIRFMFDGRRIEPQETPEDLGMEDDDEIDAMISQVGGRQ